LPALIRVAPEPHIAIVGRCERALLARMLRGLRGAWRRAGGHPRLVIFVWGKAEAAGEDAPPKRRRRRLTTRRRPRWYAQAKAMYRVVKAVDGTRGAWRHAVEALVLAGEAAFSLIWHGGPGTARERLADIETLVPLMDDQAVVVIPDHHTIPGKGVVRALISQHGWHVVPMGTLMVLAKPPVIVHTVAEETANGVA